jgi:S1-C subfamily serine protease
VSILVVCPTCASKLKVPEKMAGEKVGCPKCSRSLSVPAGSAGQGGAENTNPGKLRILPSEVSNTSQRPRPAAYESVKAIEAEPPAHDVAASGHSLSTGTLLALILGSGGAVIAVLVLGFALLRGKAEGPGGVSTTEVSADQKSDSSSSKKKSKSAASSSKKDAESDDSPPASSSRADAGQRVYRGLLKSAVFIINFEVLPNRRKVVTSGSGSLIDKTNRLVLTNYHVVGDSPKVIVFFPEYRNRKLIAEKEVFFEKIKEKSNPAPVGTVVARSTRTDLALIQLDALPDGVVALNMAKRGAVPGQRVHSIGNPGDSNALWLYTSGTVRQVSHKKWKAAGLGKVYDFDAQVVETQSPTNPGDSGGPLVNDQGDLIAVTEGGSHEAQLMSTFIHTDEVRALLDSYSRGSGNGTLGDAPKDSSSGRRRKSRP